MKKIILVLGLILSTASALAQEQEDTQDIHQDTIIVGRQKIYFDENGKKVEVTAIEAPDVLAALDLDDEILWLKAYHEKIGSCFIGEIYFKDGSYYYSTEASLRQKYGFFVGRGDRKGKSIMLEEVSPDFILKKLPGKNRILSRLRTYIKAGLCN